MKFFGFLLAFCVVSSLSEGTELSCGPSKVPALGKGACIRPTYIEGCLLYKTANKCGVCSQFYLLNKQRCDYIGGSNTKVLRGCLEISPKGQCLNCAKGFRQVGAQCKVGVRNCIKYESTGECLDCETDFSLMLGQCKHNLLLGCKVEINSHSCRECFAPFKLNGNYCHIDNCRAYNDFGCRGCECGYYLAEDMTCKEIELGCLKYSRGLCSICMSHYQLSGGVCRIDGCIQYQGTSCEKCNKNYTLTKEGGCEFKNCADWMDGECLVCLPGFGRSQGQCVKLDLVQLKCE